MSRSMKLNMKRDVILDRLRARLERLTPPPEDPKVQLSNYMDKLKLSIKERRAAAKKNYDNQVAHYNVVEQLLKGKYSDIDDLCNTIQRAMLGATYYVEFPERPRAKTNEHEINSVKYFIKTLEACADETLKLTMDDDIFRYLD